MKTAIKIALKEFIDLAITLMGKTSVGRFFYRKITNNLMGLTQKVTHQGVDLIFSTPNTLNKYRVDTFSAKEPETLKWIDNIPKGSVVWDIGANVGLYSCYAAKARSCRVFAFEPSVFNLELLARNIYINKLTELVTIIPMPLSETLALGKFNMTSTDWGGALSTFGDSYGYDGKPLCKTFEFATISISINETIELLRIPKPDYIKMDVDGIEHLILKGASVVLPSVQSVLVEINDNFQQQAEDTIQCLTKAGLFLKEKRHWEMTAGSSLEAVHNQIWHRDRSRHV